MNTNSFKLKISKKGCFGESIINDIEGLRIHLKDIESSFRAFPKSNDKFKKSNEQLNQKLARTKQINI